MAIQFCNRKVLIGYYMNSHVPNLPNVKEGFPEMSRSYSGKETCFTLSTT